MVAAAVLASGSAQAQMAPDWKRSGNTHHDKGEYDSAIANYTKAIDINARDAVAYNNRGIAYRAKGDNDSAIADYTKAIEINAKRRRRLQQPRHCLPCQG